MERFLDPDDFDLAVDIDLDMLARQHRDDDLDAWYEQTRNPLGLTLDDLAVAGWDSDPAGGSLFHPEWGAAPFLVATQIEASKIGLCHNPVLGAAEDF